MPEQYQRPPRRYARPRQSDVRKPKDEITMALAVQMALCLGLLAVLFACRQLSPETFVRWKDQYTVLVTDSSRNEKTLDYLMDMGEQSKDFWQGLEDAVAGFFTGFPAESRPIPSPPESQAPPEQSDQAGETGQTAAADRFNYHYLDQPDSRLLAVGFPAQGGPAVLPAKNSDFPSEAPAGSTMARYVLGASLRPPVTGLVTSPFAYRYHPITGAVDFHNGMDISAEEGRPILAALPGKVKETGYSQIYGNYMILEHADNLETFYAHCQTLLAQEGMIVRQGERIAKVGQTGTATGPHLHFSVLVEKNYADPRWALLDYLRPVQSGQ